MLTHLSLFSGIGGIDLATEWAGFKTIAFCEIDKRCQKILRRHWPDVPIFGDIHELTKEAFYNETGLRTVDLVAGGDPCQPNSTAGQRRGKDDDRYLWPEMLRVIHELKPTWVVNENPSGRLSMDIDKVLDDLENEGYETQPFHIPACGVGAPHPRYRIFTIAHLNSVRCISPVDSGQGIYRPEPARHEISTGTIANGDSFNVSRRDLKHPLLRETKEKKTPISVGRWAIQNGLYSPQFCRVDDGIHDRLDRTQELGNAVVPQQIYPILKAIADIENALQEVEQE